MTTHKSTPPPRAAHKPKPGGRIDSDSDKRIFRVGMKLLHLIAAHPILEVIIWIVLALNVVVPLIGIALLIWNAVT